MDNALYVSLSRQMTLRREMDVVANNIANVDTAGFKVESMLVKADSLSPSSGGVGGLPIQYVQDAGMARDFSQGALRATGGPLDVGLRGDGFFQVQTADGARFTRDGRFSLNAQGQLVTAKGDAVLADGGSPVTLDPTKGEPKIAPDGTVSQKGAVVGKIGVVRFASNSALQKAGGGYYQNVSNAASQAAPDVKLAQGMVEDSNVNPITQITRLIEVSRAYETISNLMDQNRSLSEQSIQRLGRVN